MTNNRLLNKEEIIKVYRYYETDSKKIWDANRLTKQEKVKKSLKLKSVYERIAQAQDLKTAPIVREETAREIINTLQELLELSEKISEPAIKIKMMTILQSLKFRYLPPTEEKK
jgi:hypothetical protein